MGNPLSYRDGITFTWQNNRQLASNSVSYKYDSNGMRTQKTDNSGTTYYYYDSNKNLIGLTKGNATLLFYYDSDCNVTSFKYNGTMYYYIKNLQGDIVKILDQSGTEVASYVYDAWGNIKSTTGNATLKGLNPFRYRGYVYDEETSLYYLQSHYYDPFTGRFINADDTAFIGATGTALSTNIFTYCENNPITYHDISGQTITNFSTYKTPLNKTIKSYRAFGKVVAGGLKLIGWTYSSKFLRHSLCDNPSTLLYGSNSKISKMIAKTKQYQDLISEVRKTNYKKSRPKREKRPSPLTNRN